MPDETPHLAQEPKAWYRGLNRYHWWVLILATMGWMFDTMDQQFFNLAREPAMTELLSFNALDLGREKLGKAMQEVYSAADLNGLARAGIITDEQADQALTDAQGQPRDSVSGKELACMIGESILASDYDKIGQKVLSEHPQDVFDRAGLDALVAKNILSVENVKKILDRSESGQIERADLARSIGQNRAKVEVKAAGRHVTTIFIIGWAVGGLFFGLVGDKLGRAKTMAMTILIYALFTGLSGLAQTEWQFILYRFLTALGVGGEFAAGAALVAEAMPERSRPAALGALQALSAIGNMTGCAIAYFVTPVFGWRWLFAVGALPGVLAVVVFLFLKEPEMWKAARAKAQQFHERGKALGSYAGLFSDSRWRRNAIVGMLLGVVGVGGLWGVGFFTPELTRIVVGEEATPEYREKIVAITFMLQQFGAFLGISAYTWVSLRMGRKAAFAFFFAMAFFVMGYVFLYLDTEIEAYYLLPLVGFVTLGPFGGYAIYFPELFPTRLRATGTGFCYNVGRMLAAFSSSVQGWLQSLYNNGALLALVPFLSFLSAAVNDAEMATRYASVTMIFIYLVGLVVLLFAPETKGKPLPED